MRYYYHVVFMITVGLVVKKEVRTFYETNVFYEENDSLDFRKSLAESFNAYYGGTVKAENISLLKVQLLKDMGVKSGVLKTPEVTDLLEDEKVIN